jgi:mannose-6-phosphate isomerase-like protein (cupin superfamily)
MKREEREAMRGGAGSVSITHLLEPGSRKDLRLFAEMILPPGSSIGEHRHDGETEFFLITDGVGLASDSGEETELYPGDVLVTGDGASHSIRNSGNAPLKMIAIIALDQNRPV